MWPRHPPKATPRAAGSATAPHPGTPLPPLCSRLSLLPLIQPAAIEHHTDMNPCNTVLSTCRMMLLDGGGGTVAVAAGVGAGQRGQDRKSHKPTTYGEGVSHPSEQQVASSTLLHPTPAHLILFPPLPPRVLPLPFPSSFNGEYVARVEQT